MKPQHDFWDQAASEKHFQDPFYLDLLAPFINQDSFIIEYGCGYGRILNILAENGYSNTSGFDFSPGMIQRGKQQFPDLKFQLIEHATLPLSDNSVDCAILSTVLTCIADKAAATQVIKELYRVLKVNAPFYLTDFLITSTEHMQMKYLKDFASHHDWGMYITTEGACVRHYSPEHIAELTNQFQKQWYREEEFVTMNGNPVKTFHGIYLKKLQA